MARTYQIRSDKTWSETRRELAECFGRWGVRDWSAEANVPPSRVNSRSLLREERAATVRFVRDEREVLLSLDTQRTPADNLRALYLSVEAMRMIDVRGVGEVVQSAYLQLAAPAAERDPYEVLGLRPGATADEVEAMYRVRAKSAHPDQGGSDEAMAALNRARDLALDRVAS